MPHAKLIIPFSFSFLMLGSLVAGEPKLPLISDCRQPDVVLLVALWSAGQPDIPVAPTSDMARGHAP